MTGDFVENAEEEEASLLGVVVEEGIEDCGVKWSGEATLLYPPTHARYLAARRVFPSICAMDSDSCSGESVERRSSDTSWAGDWNCVGASIFCSSKASSRPDIRPMNNERAAKTAMA